MIAFHLRKASVDVLVPQVGEAEVARVLKQALRFTEIFTLNLGVVKLGYSMTFLMNLMHNFAKIVAFVSELNHVNEGRPMSPRTSRRASSR
jgi:hypothetical protein